MAKTKEKSVKEEKTKKVQNNKKVKDTKKKDKKVKTKKEGFFKGIKKELKLVKWPAAKDIVKYTIATVVFCIILVLFFELLNMILALVKGLFN